ncbi:unnamed protein product [Owenia fusiformis]|uniref:Uncharacterized protein n=1 Tax=Owenia fusiformis TaxID=6347 RepID=A0A8J1XY38_OWEFU|nr:unnamed protein product [Owenia fusiformis]
MEVKESHLKRSLFFIEALQKVQRQVHPNLHARKDALEYIDSLIQQLLNMLCQSQPHTVTDVEDCVKKTFPHPIDKWAIGDANTALEKGKKKSPLVLPVEKLHPILVKEVLGYKVDFQVSLYIVAVLEYIAADIFKLAGNYVRNIKHSEITSQDIKVAMCADKVLMDMFFQDDEVSFSVEEEPVKQGSLKYEDIVKDLILEETQHVRDLNMIIKVFRDPFEKLFPKSGDLDAIFSNIFEVYEFSTKLLSSLEDVVEATEENSVPLIGGIFEELAENAEFVVYERYAEDLMKPHGRERLNILLQRKDLKETLDNTGNGFRDAVKYVLPKSLLGPIYHCLHILDVIKTLQSTSPTEEDQESLEQASGLLHQTKLKLDIICKDTLPKRKPGETSLRCYGRMGRQAALNKMNDLQKSIDGWEGKDIAQSSNEFVMDGVVSKYAGKRLTERHVFLFDGLLILCKQNLRRSSVTGPVGEYRLKDKFHLRKLTINDKDDTPEVKNAFEIQLKDQPSMTLVAKSIDEKNNWMWALVSLQKRSFLERMLDSRLLAEEKAQPLRLPSPEHYRFAEEDSEDNIVIDSTSPIGESPVIKGGTLLKLVERLTYHMYADPKFVRTFLTTYRSFCKPQELLKLLMERFEIPDPVLPEEESDSNEASSPTSPSANPANREDLKRFRKEYCKPVQFRVLNVLRHWVDHHYYDYERDESLLTNLEDFLEAVKGKAMRKWVESITKVIQRRKQAKTEPKDIVYEKELPPIEWHIARTPDQFDLMQLHPIEIARQVTLLEFDLYRAVKPSELVGSTEKKDKRESAPNLHKMIHFSTMFTFWLEKCIVEAENFEERVAVMSRIIEIMIMFQENNNFSGVLEVVSAMNSAPIHRLEHTRLELPTKLSKALEEACELNSDHLRKYIEKLRSINPPCVPFLGMYLTNILHIEEGNPDILPNKEGIINFSKRRKVAEITGEIQQYQNQPYCLSLEADIRGIKREGEFIKWPPEFVVATQQLVPDTEI